MKKVLSADVLSPILAYMRLDAPHKMILESIPREKENARFSIVAYRPVSEVKFENGVLYYNDQIVEEDPLDFLNRITVKTKTSEELPFNGGAIGFVGYDLIGLYENIGSIPEDTIGTPDLHFFLYESYVIFDHKKEKVYVVEENLYSGRSEAEQASSLEQVLAQLARPAKEEFQDKDLHALHFHNHLEQKEFEEMVALARDYIRKGDMFQCVLSQRFSADFSGKPLDYYRNLRVTNPSNYLYFYDFGEYQIIGASPESLVSVKDRVVTTNPIAGTRPRGIDEEADRQLLPGLASIEALKATLPAGTVSGAPKIRAMKRIYEAEKEKRGVYAGAIGYLSVTGDLDFAIAIRTMILKNKKAYVQAGAGIVYDSIAENEYQETVNKAKSMTRIGEEG